MIDDEFLVAQQSVSVWKQAIEADVFKQTVRWYHDNINMTIGVPYIIISNSHSDKWFNAVKEQLGESEAISLNNRLTSLKAERFENDLKYYKQLAPANDQIKNPLKTLMSLRVRSR